MKALSLPQSKDMANVKVFADKQTDKWTQGQTDEPKTICTRPIDAGGGHKNVQFINEAL